MKHIEHFPNNYTGKAIFTIGRGDLSKMKVGEDRCEKVTFDIQKTNG